MIERLKEHFPSFSHLQESSLSLADLSNLWQVTALDNDGVPFGSGFSKVLNIARKIAIAEFIERNFVLSLKNSGESAKWKFDQYPTACGFAAGFDPINTQIRSIGEAIERWALSKWIDDKCYLEQEHTPLWSPECTSLLVEFDNIFVFKKVFLYNIKNRIIPYHLSVVVALSGAGSFMGSAVRSSFQDALVHSLVEAHRHLIISRQDRNFNLFPYNRIKYFAENQTATLESVALERETEWPQPVLGFQHNYQNELFCISRTIFKDWIPWERGALSRMLY